nr:hypothetical protein [uncultured Paludibaculum sp.]
MTSALPLSDLTLEVQDVSQKAVKTKAFTNLKGQRQRWLDDYSLTPGTYVLQVREVPKFKLEIVIGK